MTPWHSSIAVGVNGSFRTVHAEEVRETHDLVLRHGQPYHFREKSDLYDFGETKVQFEHLYPCGLIIRPAGELTAKPSLRDVDINKLRKLAELQSPIVLRGFAETTERELFISKAHELGEVLPWSFWNLAGGERPWEKPQTSQQRCEQRSHAHALRRHVQICHAEGRERERHER